MSRGTRAVFYFFFAVTSLLLGSTALGPGTLFASFGQTAAQPLPAIYGSLVVLVAIVAPILLVVAALYTLLFGRDN